jgi:hypothetical protein
MADTDTLFCEAGQHEWQREKKRGKKPKNCPDHQPIVSKATMPPEEAARRRAEGRARAKAERDKAGIQRVLDYKRWVVRDAETTIQRALAAAAGEKLPPRPRMPAMPNKADYDAATAAGIHKGIVVEDEA